MTTIRVAHREQWVTVKKTTIRDPKLSLRARGLLATMLSYPDNWRFNSDEISHEVREGRDAVRRAMDELADAGYLERNKCQVAGGRWITELVLYETPRAHATAVDNSVTDDGFSVVGATRGNAPKDQVAPTPGKPTPGKPAVGEPGVFIKTVPKDCRGEHDPTRVSGLDAGPFDDQKLTEADLERISNPAIRRRIAQHCSLE